MSLILNIDTSGKTAAVSMAENGIAIHTIINADQKDHAGFLHNAIHELVQKTSVRLSSLDAIAVVSGPGSYTGLRVGMAGAKGLCYALGKPFITIDSLRIMSDSVIGSTKKAYSLYCPLIDARRMEVFTALFDNELNVLSNPGALILTESSFTEILETSQTCFFGSGAEKFEAISKHKNAVFLPVTDFTTSMCKLSFELFSTKKFTHLVDSEPLYIKEFYSPPDLGNKK